MLLLEGREGSEYSSKAGEDPSLLLSASEPAFELHIVQGDLYRGLFARMCSQGSRVNGHVEVGNWSCWDRRVYRALLYISLQKGFDSRACIMIYTPSLRISASRIVLTLSNRIRAQSM